MIEKRRVLQPLNLIFFLIFILTVGITVCLPIFEESHVLLQLAWTGYLLLGMVFLFCIGGMIAAGKKTGKYLKNSTKGRLWLGQLLFFVCIGSGAAFRLREIVENSGTLGRNASLNLFFYLGTGFLVYFIVKHISGFGGAVAVTIFLSLCPLFNFAEGLLAEVCFYTVLFLGAVLFLLSANRFLEIKGPGWRDFLLTMFGAAALAGATVIHISAVSALIPCMLFLGRKNGEEKSDKKEQRGRRCLLFLAFYACTATIFYLIKMQNPAAMELPLDQELLSLSVRIGKEPENFIVALFDKISGLFTIKGQGEYYNGLLLGISLFALVNAVILFKVKREKDYFPLYLFNWYFLVSIFLKESLYNKLLLFILLSCTAASVMADLARAVIARKQKKTEEEQAAIDAQKAEKETDKTEAEKPEEKTETEKAAERKETEESEEETESEETAAVKSSLPHLTLEEILPVYIPEQMPKQKPEQMPKQKPEQKQTEETIIEDKSCASLEKQIQELVKREDLILGIVEKQSVRISRLEEELKNQRLLAKKLERRYRQELAMNRNKKR